MEERIICSAGALSSLYYVGVEYPFAPTARPCFFGRCYYIVTVSFSVTVYPLRLSTRYSWTVLRGNFLFHLVPRGSAGSLS